MKEDEKKKTISVKLLVPAKTGLIRVCLEPHTLTERLRAFAPEKYKFLIYRGRKLEDGKMLSCYSIGDGDIVHCWRTPATLVEKEADTDALKAESSSRIADDCTERNLHVLIGLILALLGCVWGLLMGGAIHASSPWSIVILTSITVVVIMFVVDPDEEPIQLAASPSTFLR